MKALVRIFVIAFVALGLGGVYAWFDIAPESDLNNSNAAVSIFLITEDVSGVWKAKSSPSNALVEKYPLHLGITEGREVIFKEDAPNNIATFVTYENSLLGAVCELQLHMVDGIPQVTAWSSQPNNIVCGEFRPGVGVYIVSRYRVNS